MNDYEQKQSTLIIYQPLQPYKLYMSHAYVVSRHREVCLVFQLAIQPLFLSTNACGSPDYFWIPWLDIWLPPLEPPNCFNQLPSSIFFLSTTPAPALQEQYFSLRGSSPHIPSALFPKDYLTCGLSRSTYIYPLQWVLKTKARN